MESNHKLRGNSLVMMKKLKQYGFEKVGQWKKGKPKSGISFTLDKFENERVIYTFIIQKRVKYLGICDNYKTNLKDRISRYRSKAGGSTNQKVAEKIADSLLKGHKVEIWALKTQGLRRYKGIEVDCIKGLENPLLRVFNNKGISGIKRQLYLNKQNIY